MHWYEPIWARGFQNHWEIFYQHDVRSIEGLHHATAILSHKSDEGSHIIIHVVQLEHSEQWIISIFGRNFVEIVDFDFFYL